MSTPLPNSPEIQIPTDGADSDVWGLENNAVLTAYDRMLSGAVFHDMTPGDWALTDEEAQFGRLVLLGTVGTTLNIVIPANRFRTYQIFNFTNTPNGECMAVIQSGNSEAVFVPQNCALTVCCIPGQIRSVGVPARTVQAGGFPGVIRQFGFTYNGPGIYFDNRQVGLGSPAAGFLSFFLAAGNAAAEARLSFANDVNNPLFGAHNGAGAYNTGFYFPGGAEVGVACQAQRTLRITTGGVGVGANDPVGAGGTINSGGYYRSGVPMPFQFPVNVIGIGISNGANGAFAHGIGGPPNHVFAKLRCVASADTYLTGDELDASCADNLAWGGNASVLFFGVGPVTIPRKGIGTPIDLTFANWRLDLTGAWP